MKFLHELPATVPLNVRRIVSRIERLAEALAREAEPLCTEIESLYVLNRLPELFGDEGAKDLIRFGLKLSELNQAMPDGEPLLSEHLLSQALVEGEPIAPLVSDSETGSGPESKDAKTSKKSK